MRKAVVFLAVVIGLGWWYWGRTLEPVEVIRAQLTAINQRDYARAYSYLSRSAQDKLPLLDFQQLIEAQPQVLSTYDSVFLWRKIDNDTATIRGTLESGNLQQTGARYVLVKEKQKWVIDSFQWQDITPRRTS
jgi:hypothetical protein